LEEVLSQFGLSPGTYTHHRFGSGHINNTFLVTSNFSDEKFILQKINTYVFKDPEIISENIEKASDFLKINHPDYTFIHSIKTVDDKPYALIDGAYWRLSPFIKSSQTVNIASNLLQAYEAASAFGRLTKNLHGLPLKGLRESIPGFHNLELRFMQFQEALQNGNKERIAAEQELTSFYLGQEHWVQYYNDILKDEKYPKRLVHHDTKINNVLLNKDTGKALAVCDLDTLMPGIVISDLGDMIRTYTSVESEESVDFENVKVRLDYIKALFEGFLSQTGPLLTDSEKKSLFFAGPFLIYMQGLRFLTDYFNDDVYYPVKYTEHNLNRARNQAVLLEDYLKKENEIKRLIEEALR